MVLAYSPPSLPAEHWTLTDSERRLLALVAHHEPRIRTFRALAEADGRAFRTVYDEAWRLRSRRLLCWEDGNGKSCKFGKVATLRLADGLIVSRQGSVVGRLLWSRP